MMSNISNTRKRRPRQKKGKGVGASPLLPGGTSTGLSAQIETWVPLFPAKTTRRLRYSTNIALSSTSGAVATYVFSCNGLFDPDITSTGHQPMGFDQMMLSYNHYCVLQSFIRCSFKNTLATVPQAAIRIDAAATPVTVIDNIIEEGLLVTTPLEIKGDYGANKMLSIGLDISKHQGVVNAVDNPSLQGNAAANPAEQSYFHVQLWDSAAVTGSANVDVEIEFLAVFTEPRVLTPSQLKLLRKQNFFTEERKVR